MDPWQAESYMRQVADFEEKREKLDKQLFEYKLDKGRMSYETEGKSPEFIEGFNKSIEYMERFI